MKTYIGRTIAIFASILLVPSFVSAATFGDFTYSTNLASEVTIGEYANKGVSGAITIPATIAGDPVRFIGLNAFRGCDLLTEVIIPEGVTSIEESAFTDCRSLMTVDMASTITNIGFAAFYNCTSLTDISLPENLSHLGGSAFWSCTGLTDVTIPTSVKEMGQAPFGLSGVKSVKIANGVEAIGPLAFAYCRALKVIDIPGSVTNIADQAFAGCSDLEGIYFAGDIPTEVGVNIFSGVSPAATVYVLPLTTGWDETFATVKVALGAIDGDDDNDGVPSGIEILGGLNPFLGDTDGDGMIDGAEMIAGTLPTDESSVLLVSQSLSASGDSIDLTWGTVEGRLYDVMWTDNLAHAFVAIPSLTGLDHTQNAATDLPAGFYKVNVRQSPTD